MCVDDIAVIARNKSLVEVLQKLKVEPKNRGLEINQHKTKYMKIFKRKGHGLVKRWRSDSTNTVRASDFKYLETTVEKNNLSGRSNREFK